MALSNLPPGVTINDICPPEGPCDVCGRSIDDCICPECLVCGSYGDPKCYEQHGLTRSDEQITSRNQMDEVMRQDAEAEKAYWDAFEAEGEEE